VRNKAQCRPGLLPNSERSERMSWQ